MRTVYSTSLAISVATGALLTAAVAGAVTIQATASGDVFGVVQQDIQGPAAAGNLFAEVEYESGTLITGSGQAVARAAQNDEGIAAVLAEGAYQATGTNVLEAETRWSDTVTNNHPNPIEYLYSFFIVPPRLTLLDLAPTAAPAVLAEWEIEVLLNGNRLFFSRAEMSGGGHASVLETAGTSLDPRPFIEAGGMHVGYDFSEYSNIVPLGFYDPGQDVTVEAILRVRVESRAPGQGARAAIGDPLKLGSDPGIVGQIIESEPVAAEPQSWSAVKALYRR